MDLCVLAALEVRYGIRRQTAVNVLLVLTGMEILALPVLAGSSGTQHQTVVFVQQTQGGMEFRASIFPPALADSFTTQPPIRASVLKAKIGTALSASPAQEVSSGILTLIPANALLDSSGLAPAAWPALADEFGLPKLTLVFVLMANSRLVLTVWHVQEDRCGLPKLIPAAAPTVSSGLALCA
jgi:hypothetical protein